MPREDPGDRLAYERRRWCAGFARVGGVDEAGRGPLAGPVYAACVVFERALAESLLAGEFSGLTDSKKLTPAARVRFRDRLVRISGISIGVGHATAVEIDRINILRATHMAMARAAEALPGGADFLLVDGLPVGGLPYASEAIVRGDSKSLSIAAASVIAKVTRDEVMLELDARYPVYGFRRHKGYGSREHLEALHAYGPSPEHRRSFRPVREAYGLYARGMDHEGVPEGAPGTF